MRKTPYPLELLETVASLFSLNILLLPNHPMLGQLVTMLEDLMKPS